MLILEKEVDEEVIEEVIEKTIDFNYLDELKHNIMETIINYGPKIIFAIILLFVGFKIIKYINKLIKRILDKSQTDNSVTTFALSIISIFLKIVLVLSLLPMVGFQTTSLVAILGSAGLAIGLALQGSLANFAGGVLILILKPFVVGDYIKENSAGNEGVVSAIDIFYTTLKTIDNKTIVIPNGALSNNSIINFTKASTRRLDLKIGVSYSSDLLVVKEILNELVLKHPLVLKQEENSVNVSELGDHAVIFLIIAWCDTENYWKLKFDLNEQIKIKLDQEGINIPFPQLDVHMV